MEAQADAPARGTDGGAQSRAWGHTWQDEALGGSTEETTRGSHALYTVYKDSLQPHVFWAASDDLHGVPSSGVIE